MIEGTGKPLLGKKTAIQLNVLKIGPQLVISEDVKSNEDNNTFRDENILHRELVTFHIDYSLKFKRN